MPQRLLACLAVIMAVAACRTVSSSSSGKQIFVDQQRDFQPILTEYSKDSFIENGNVNWDKLNRKSTNLKDFPTAIPLHLIVQQSRFFSDNPQNTSTVITNP